MEVEKLNKLSIEEYLAIERESEVKYEYHNGSIFAMAGGTLDHGLIWGNIFGELREGLKNKNSSCKVINSEIKLHVQSKNNFLYPDAMVICGDIKKSQDDPNAVTNPVLIVEVLSKTTSSYDRGYKFYFYRQIKSLQEYVLIEQDKALIEIYKREAGLWGIMRISGLENEIYLSSLEISVALHEIYLNTEFQGKE